uniref:Uncharacterized protein n=1 Tax=Oryza sativa subsp. japonica TaxID=39947 RepID=Q655N0_ORYSJ|nr:hypothetical protein [Oryza sativa Japonica Group]
MAAAPRGTATRQPAAARHGRRRRGPASRWAVTAGHRMGWEYNADTHNARTLTPMNART